MTSSQPPIPTNTPAGGQVGPKPRRLGFWMKVGLQVGAWVLAGFILYQLIKAAGTNNVIALGHWAETSGFWVLLVIRVVMYVSGWLIIADRLRRQAILKPDDIVMLRGVLLRLVIAAEFLFGINVIGRLIN